MTDKNQTLNKTSLTQDQDFEHDVIFFLHSRYAISASVKIRCLRFYVFNDKDVFGLFFSTYFECNEFVLYSNAVVIM